MLRQHESARLQGRETVLPHLDRELGQNVGFLPECLHRPAERTVGERPIFQGPIEKLLQCPAPRGEPSREGRLLEGFHGLDFRELARLPRHSEDEVEVLPVLQPQSLPRRFDFVEGAEFSLGQRVRGELGHRHRDPQIAAFARRGIQRDVASRVASGRQILLGRTRLVADQPGGASQRIGFVSAEGQVVEQPLRECPRQGVDDFRHIVGRGRQENPSRSRRTQKCAQRKLQKLPFVRHFEPKLQGRVIENIGHGQIGQVGEFRRRVGFVPLPERAAPRLDGELRVGRLGDIQQRVGEVRSTLGRHVNQHAPVRRGEQRQAHR